MPFTFSHPVAAVPFRRWGLNLSALIVGSMAPDFEYFLRLSASSHFGHTLPGLFLFCVPAGLLALWVFHAISKYPMFSLFPVTHQERLVKHLDSFSYRSVKEFRIIIISLLIGAVTHIVWDAFTHSYGWAVQQFPVLSLPLLTTSQGTLRIYKVLQHSGFVGMLILLYWYLKWMKNAPKFPVPRLFQLSGITKIAIILSLGGLAGIIGLLYGILKLPPIQDFYSFRFFVVRAGIVSTSSFLLSLFIFSVCWHIVIGIKKKNSL